MKNKFNYSCFFLFLALIGCTNHAPSETFLIPENYKGAIVLVFENTNKEDDQKKERIYKIPESGILYTPYSRTTGILKHKYYYVNGSGNKVKEIKKFDYEEYHNNIIDPDEVNRLDMYDGRTIIKSKPKKENTNQKTISSDDFEHIKWILITLGSSKDDRDILRKEGFAMKDSIFKYYPEKYDR